MKVAWFSAGVSSFLSAYMAKPDKLIYIHIDDQHEDTKRFLHDCEWFLGKEIEVLQSNYKSVDEVARQFRYLNGVAGAKCTEGGRTIIGCSRPWRLMESASSATFS